MLFNIHIGCFGSSCFSVTEDPYFNQAFLFSCICLIIMFFVLKCIKVFPLSKQDGWEPVYQTPDVLGQEMAYSNQILVIPNRKTKTIFLKAIIFLIVTILILTPLNEIIFSSPVLRSFWIF